MIIRNLGEKASKKYKETKASIAVKNELRKKKYYFIKKYKMLDKQILEIIGKDNYKNLLFLCNFGINKNNKIDWNVLIDNGILSKTSIPRFRSELVKAYIVGKIKTTNGFGWYLNPMIQETGTPDNDELFDYFKEGTQRLYNINTNI